MFWLYQNTTSGSSSLDGLYFWNRQSNTFGLLNSSSALGVPSTLPANAAFAWDSFFYIPSYQNILRRILITYDLNGRPSGARWVGNYLINAPAAQAANMTFGDIAINPISEQLYASTSKGQFFRVDLSNMNNPDGLPYTLIYQSPSQPSLQIGEWRALPGLHSPPYASFLRSTLTSKSIPLNVYTTFNIQIPVAAFDTFFQTIYATDFGSGQVRQGAPHTIITVFSLTLNPTSPDNTMIVVHTEREHGPPNVNRVRDLWRAVRARPGGLRWMRVHSSSIAGAYPKSIRRPDAHSHCVPDARPRHQRANATWRYLGADRQPYQATHKQPQRAADAFPYIASHILAHGSPYFVPWARRLQLWNRQ